MRILDSTKTSGKYINCDFNSKTKSFSIKKNGYMDYYINISDGKKYITKIISRKNIGDGDIEVLFILDSEVKHRIKMISNPSLSERVFEFVANFSGYCNVKIVRNENSFGRVEIGRFTIEQYDIHTQNSNKLDDTEECEYSIIKNKVAIVIPYRIYGGAEVYIRNLINDEFIKIFDLTIIYFEDENQIKNSFNVDDIKHVIVGRNEFCKYITNNKFESIVFYNRKEIYDLLLTIRNENLKLIEIYHGDFKWPGSLSSESFRKNLFKFIKITKNNVPISGIDNIQEYIPPSINVSKKRKYSKERKIIGTVGRLSYEKNTEYLFELAKIMPDFEFIIFGEGNRKESLTLKMNNLKLKNVKFMGFEKNIEIIYNSFDTFILPSRIEGLPLTILEALNFDCDVYATNVGYIADIIDDVSTGKFLSLNPYIDRDILINGYIKDYKKINEILDMHDEKNVSKKLINMLKNEKNIEISGSIL